MVKMLSYCEALSTTHFFNYSPLSLLLSQVTSMSKAEKLWKNFSQYSFPSVQKETPGLRILLEVCVFAHAEGVEQMPLHHTIISRRPVQSNGHLF